MKLQRLAYGLAAILLLSACGAKSAEKPEKARKQEFDMRFTVFSATEHRGQAA